MSDYYDTPSPAPCDGYYDKWYDDEEEWVDYELDPLCIRCGDGLLDCAC